MRERKKISQRCFLRQCRPKWGSTCELCGRRVFKSAVGAEEQRLAVDEIAEEGQNAKSKNT